MTLLPTIPPPPPFPRSFWALFTLLVTALLAMMWRFGLFRALQ